MPAASPEGEGEGGILGCPGLGGTKMGWEEVRDK